MSFLGPKYPPLRVPPGVTMKPGERLRILGRITESHVVEVDGVKCMQVDAFEITGVEVHPA